jgi:hypothetical protein
VRTSLILSIVLHIVVLAAVLLNFRSSTSRDIGPQPVAVELIPSDKTQVKAGKKTAETLDPASAAAPQDKAPEPPPKAPDPKPADKVAERQAAPPPKPAEPEAKPEPKTAAAKPEPAPAEPPKREEPPKPKPEKAAESKPKKPETKPEGVKKAEAKPEPKPVHAATPFRDKIADLLKSPGEEPQKSQPAPPAQTKQQFDADRIAALLNRDPKAGSPATQDGPKEPWRKPSSLEEQAMGMDQPVAPPREVQGAPGGADPRMSATEIDYFRSQVSRCWSPPVGGLGAEEIVVKLRIELNKDGTLVRPPQLANGGASQFFTAAADSAMRAVLQCQPYTMPVEKFSQWRDMLLNFDPRRMYGG